MYTHIYTYIYIYIYMLRLTGGDGRGPCAGRPSLFAPNNNIDDNSNNSNDNDNHNDDNNIIAILI